MAVTANSKKPIEHGKRSSYVQRDYYERNKDEIAAKQRDYRERNKDEIAAKKRDYRERNKTKDDSGITEADGACPWCAVGNHALCAGPTCACCGQEAAPA